MEGIGWNHWKCLKMAGLAIHDCKWLDQLEWLEIAGNCCNWVGWLEIAVNYYKWLEWQKWLDMAEK